MDEWSKKDFLYKEASDCRRSGLKLFNLYGIFLFYFLIGHADKAYYYKGHYGY